MVHSILPKPFKAILMLKRIEKYNKRALERPHLFLQQEVARKSLHGNHTTDLTFVSI